MAPDKLLAAATTLLVLLTTTGCGGQNHNAPTPEQTWLSSSAPSVGPTVLPQTNANDPRQGWVTVGKDPGVALNFKVFKRCDGSTLLYVTSLAYNGGGAVSAIADSPECKP